MKKLILATKNQGKVREILDSLKDFNLEISGLEKDFPDIDETGTTFEENATLKAEQVYNKLKILTLSDDSGLEVDYLCGEPGVYSARFAGENATDLDNCNKLLKEMDEALEDEHTARFKCVMVLYDGVSNHVFEGVCEGKIINEMRGNDGFGYDPLFVPDGFTQTYAELDLDTKNKISHRGKALAKIKEYLQLHPLKDSNP